MPYRDQGICHCKHINAWTHLCFTTSLVYKYHLLSTQNKKIGTIFVLNNDAWNENISICRFPLTAFSFQWSWWFQWIRGILGYTKISIFQYALLLLWPSYVARGNSFNYGNSIFYVIHVSVVPYSLMGIHSFLDGLIPECEITDGLVEQEMSFRQSKF